MRKRISHCSWLTARCFLFLLLLALPARAGFVVTDSPIAGVGSSIAANASYIYVGRIDKPSVLVYNPRTNALVTEISLIGISQDTPAAGVASLCANPRTNLIYVGAWPYAQAFSITNTTGSSLGYPPVPYPSDFTTRGETVTAIHYAASQSQLYSGLRLLRDSTTFLFTSAGSVTGKVALGDVPPVVGNTIASEAGAVILGTTDTGVNRAGRVFRYAGGAVTRIFVGDSSVTASAGADGNMYFASSPSGVVRRVSSAGAVTTAVTFAETTIHTMLYGRDRSESVVFIGGDTQYLRAFNLTTFESRTCGRVDTHILSIRALCFCADPERIYGIALLPNGQSCLFYYDTVAPRALTVSFAIDPSLQQPGRGDTYSPPLTRGTYTIRVATDESLRQAPTITLTYSDGSTQNIPMSGSGTYFTGTFTIDASRPEGMVTVSFIGIDDAGNVGTTIVSGGTFDLRRLGSVSIANNQFRPNFGEYMTVRYCLAAPAYVTVKVYNMRGQLVADLSPGNRGAGDHADVVWRGRNDAGKLVASGVYLVHIEAGAEFKSTLKVMMIR